MKESYLQQGDVIAKRRDKLPIGLTKLDHKTLALGEATGHSHTFYDDGAELFEDQNKVLWLLITKPVALKHEEHHPIEFNPGVYEIGIVKEYNHFEEEARMVVD